MTFKREYPQEETRTPTTYNWVRVLSHWSQSQNESFWVRKNVALILLASAIGLPGWLVVKNISDGKPLFSLESLEQVYTKVQKVLSPEVKESK